MLQPTRNGLLSTYWTALLKKTSWNQRSDSLAYKSDRKVACGARVSVRLAARVGLLCIVFSTRRMQGSEAAYFYGQRAQQFAIQSYETWQRASSVVASDWQSRSGVAAHATDAKTRAAARQQSLHAYLNEMVPAMAPSAQVAHLPKEQRIAVDFTNLEKKWTVYYEEAKTRLRPDVSYKWKSNAQRGDGTSIALSTRHVEVIQENFDILMWYRNELDKRVIEEGSQGARHLQLFLDYFVADLLKSLPTKPEINMATGKVEAAEWELDEQRLREQVVMAYRYLIAKYQTYPQYQQFGPADRELLLTLMKISFLMGAHLNPEWFDDLKVDLTADSQKSSWKKPMADALRLLQSQQSTVGSSSAARAAGAHDVELPCIIVIPAPRPLPPPVVPPKAEEPERIEIIVRPKSASQ
jgi:hypothetical protein